jgi:hypothetical protein
VAEGVGNTDDAAAAISGWPTSRCSSSTLTEAFDRSFDQLGELALGAGDALGRLHEAFRCPRTRDTEAPQQVPNLAATQHAP